MNTRGLDKSSQVVRRLLQLGRLGNSIRPDLMEVGVQLNWFGGLLVRLGLGILIRRPKNEENEQNHKNYV